MLSSESVLVLSAAGLIAVAMLGLLAAWSWRQWLLFRTRELEMAGADRAPPVTGRIELADLRARVKKLEAIAAGID